jgi:hypothetical protein
MHSVQELVATLELTTAELADLRRRAERLERAAAALRSVIAEAEQIAGDRRSEQVAFEAHRVTFEVAPPDPEGPRGTTAVLSVMREDPTRLWKVVELKHELLRRGWAPTPKAVEANIKRLKHLGAVVSPAYGYYQLRRAAAVGSRERVA